MIKVVPKSGYLKELRGYLFDKLDKQHYSNVGAVNLFYENYPYVDHSRLSYTVNLDKISIGWLISNAAFNMGCDRGTVGILIQSGYSANNGRFGYIYGETFIIKR